MRKIYLILGMCCLISHQVLPQYGSFYASSVTKQAGSEFPREESCSLKTSLSEVEKLFDVSIAYKDEWVENITVKKSAVNYETIEEALDKLLAKTNVSYEKAGSGFYVISPKLLRSETPARPGFRTRIPEIPGEVFASVKELPAGASSHVFAPFINFDVQVSGRVTDESGSAFPGVNIVIKGTSQGTSTDGNGQYSLSVPDENAVLVFSFIGYTTVEETVGSRTNINVSLKPSVQALEEVVVTALGIEKSTKGLGYATTKVDADQLSINRTPNLMNALTGKIAGVSISGLGTGPAGTSKIRIRGQSSIGGQNNPLIVVNGVPMDNNNFGTNPTGGTANSDGSNAVRGGGVFSDGGDNFISINPDDVESMTVLKGAAAAALYGSRAANGVIMITTKSKGTGEGLGITYNLNYTDENPLDFTDYQYEFGQGENGVRPTAANPTSGQWSFGERIQPGMTQVLFNNLTVPYEAQRGILKQFYRHGQNMTNTITLSTNSEKGGMNVSVSDMQSKGIVPNNSFSRKTINLGFTYDLSDKFSFRGNVNYSNEHNKNPPNIANQDNSIPTVLMAMANTMPLDVLEANKFNAAGNEYIYSRFMNRTNPYFTLSEQFNNIRRDRIFGNISVKYDLAKWLYVQLRGGEDYYSRDQDYNNFPTGQASLGPAPSGYVNGMYTQEQRRFRETNVDFLLYASQQFGDIGFNATFGGNQLRRRADLNSVQVTDFVVRGLYTVQNGRAKDPLYDLQTTGVNSLYGGVDLNWRQIVYLSATLRNDWFSTLAPEHNSILYPSVTASFLFSDALGSKPIWLSLGKIRAAYAEVGSDNNVGFAQNVLYYGANANQFANQPVGNTGNSIPNPDLRPSRTSEGEFGLEMKMFDSRVNFDFAVYKKTTVDQIVSAQVSDASSFLSTKINTGKSENRGLEMMVNVVPVRATDFQWDVTFAGSYNITKVLSLLTNTPGENITVGTHVFNGSVQQIVGKEMGQIVGFGYRRNDAGQIIYGGNGVPLPTTAQIPFGSALPKWVGGVTNAFNYKGITLSALVDFRLGGKLLSGTNFNAYRHGLSKETLPGREGGVVGEGVNQAGETNTVAAAADVYYAVVRGAGLVEPVVYDAGFVKLRQITVGYDFTKFLPANFPVKGVRLNLVANNVLMLKKWVPNIDPESFGYTSDNLVGMESPGLLTTRSMGFNLNVKF